MTQLKLTILDQKDLEVLSTHIQDALVAVGDMTFLPGKKRFVLVVNRFDWLKAEESRNKLIERKITGVHFEAVRHVRSKNITFDKEDVILDLLSVSFKPGDLPAGVISLTFAAGAEIELEVDYVEALMNDLGPRWEAHSKPQHENDQD